MCQDLMAHNAVLVLRGRPRIESMGHRNQLGGIGQFVCGCEDDFFLNSNILANRSMLEKHV